MAAGREGAPAGVTPEVRRLLGGRRPEVESSSDVFLGPSDRISLECWWGRGPPLICIGRNPGRATRHRTDGAVRMAARRAWMAGMGGLAVLDLFPRVAEPAADLWASGADEAAETMSATAMAAWVGAWPGAPVLFAPGSDPDARHGRRAAEAEAALRGAGARLPCLGLTAGGEPRDPSRTACARAMARREGPWPTGRRGGWDAGRAPGGTRPRDARNEDGTFV